MFGFPDVSTYREWAGLKGGSDEPIILAQRAAAAYIEDRCTYASCTPEVEPDLVYAHLLLTQRMLARKNSPEAVLGFGDLAVRISSRDPDVIELIGPHLKIAVA